MDITGQRGLELDIAYVLLVVKNALVEMGDAPAERDVVVEELGEFSGSLSGIGVTPSAEGNHDFVLLVESHIAVHHGRDTDTSQNLEFRIVLLEHILAEISIAVLQTIPDGLGAIGPESVDQLVFPGVTALGDGFVLLVDEDGLDTGRAKLDTENGFTLLDGFFCCHNISYYAQRAQRWQRSQRIFPSGII